MPLQQLVWAQELPEVDPQPQGQLQPIGVHGHGLGQHSDQFILLCEGHEPLLAFQEILQLYSHVQLHQVQFHFPSHIL